MKLIIGADHAGFFLKEIMKHYLIAEGNEITDVGTSSDTSVDYPDFASQVARRVSTGEFGKGILVCGSGVGMAIVANKYPPVRAVLGLDMETTLMSRKHNDTNILALAGRRTSPDEAKTIVQTWLDTDFEGGRHKMRLEKITHIENGSI
jgi:ribose 5-phosphate isomerase B